MRNKRWTIALAILLLALQLACSFSRGVRRSSHTSHGHSSGHFANETDSRVITHEVRPEMREVELDVRVDLDAGALSWRVLDPHGEVRWEYHAEAGQRLRESRDLKPHVGEWRIEIELRDAAGEYDFIWEAR